MNFSTYLPEKKFNMDLNYVVVPVTIRDETTLRCGITFQRSGKLAELDVTHAPANFSNFNFTQKSTQLFISKTIFDDIITSNLDKYSLRGKISDITSDVLNLPYRLTIGYFSKILPSASNIYTANTPIEAHWSIYEVNMIYANGTITATARLDCTVYLKPNMITKQIYSFDTDLILAVSVATDGKKVNLNLDNVYLNNMKIRENYGYSNILELKDWIKQTFYLSLKANPYKLFSNTLDFSWLFFDHVSAKVVDNGILIYQ
jgi:hypothetical protein